MVRVFPAIALIAAQLMVMAASEVVEFNYDIARSYAGDGVSFLPTDPNPLPGHLLMGLESSISPPNDPSILLSPLTIPCSTKTDTTVSGKVTVLIAISRCLSDKSVEVIREWAKGLQASQKTFFQNGQTTAVDFAVASIPGTCQALTEAEAHGQQLMADEERLAGFSDFARVLDAMPSSTPTETIVGDPTATSDVKTKVPVAVVSFVDNDSSFKTVQQYEMTEKIKTTFNFKICEKGKNCGIEFDNCITLNDSVEVFMYSPFTIATTLNCAELKDGSPVVYLDSSNKRQCVCTCPAGSKLSSDGKKCEKIDVNACQCVWANAPNGGYKKKINDAITMCEFKGITAWGVPPPVPLDNYVDKRRENQNDGNSGKFLLKDGPRIDLITGRIEVPVYNIDNSRLTSYPSKLNDEVKKLPLSKAGPAFTEVKSTYSWSDYQSNRAGKIDSLKYTAFGKYSIEVDAFDYNTTSTDCKGCIAIVDNFRPEATTECPKKICDKSTSDCDKDEGVVELTTANLLKIEGQIKSYYKFQDLAKNDVCAANTSPKRCDDECLEVMNFSEDKYSNNVNYRSDGANFYDVSKIRSDLINVGKLSSKDLENNEGDPVAYGQCMRCVSLSTTLKEYWTDFTCGRDYDTEKCEGKAGQTCELKQCIAVFGDTIAVSSAKLKEDIVKESKSVVNELTQEGYNTETQVHVALECTKFVDNAVSTSWDPKCVYKAKVQDLLDIDTKANIKSIFSDKDAKDFVTWRYRVDTEAWSAWGTETNYVYKKAETKISVEAWTKCGIVQKFFFYVHLHLNNPIDVCGSFRAMWYQATNRKLQAPDNFCMYPKSDFAELTFDYHANIGLQFSPDRLSMNIAKVECRLKYDECSDDGAKIVDVTADSREIVSRFAVLAQRRATAPLTKFHVTCDFSYKRYGKQGVLKQTCNQDFYITDCTGPEIDKPCPLDDPACSADTCVNSPLPAPFEACGGNIVSIGKDGKTAFSKAGTGDSSCCEFCNGKYSTTCKTLSALPLGVNEIKRCEPAPKPGTTSRGSYYNLAAADALESATESPMGTVTLLLSASAMVALVALVVVKRRRAAVEVGDKDVMEDAYYPLLH